MNKPKAQRSMETVTITTEDAFKLLDHNKINRPLSQIHVNRLARQITLNKWRFNGDTIKISEDGDVLDGQHRLWAVMEAKKPIETIVVRGIRRDAFATIDTLRKQRNGSDVIALTGQKRYQTKTATALAWLIRYQRGVLATYRDPQNRIENSDIEEAFGAHPMMVHAVERCMSLRDLINPAIIAFLYYLLTNKNEALANRLLDTLLDPAGIGVTDPLFKLRAYLSSTRRREALMTIALSIKAINAAARDEKLHALAWRSQGDRPEPFPALEVK